MNSLDVARVPINEIDAQMANPFVRHMRTVEVVAEYEKEYSLLILDTLQCVGRDKAI